MSQDPEAIRQDIEETRTRMSETVEALAYKTDVPSRARDAINERVETVKGKVSDAVNAAGSTVGGAASNAKATFGNVADAVQPGVQNLRSFGSMASQSPLGLAVGSIAVGFLIGLCLPVTEIERERVGRIGEQMSEQAKSAAAGAIEQGKAAVTQAIGDAISGTSTTQT